jgi:hypothetical protein
LGGKQQPLRELRQMNTFTIHHQRILAAKSICRSYSASKLVTYLDTVIDTVSLYDSPQILNHLIISDITISDVSIAIVWLRLAKLYPAQYSMFSWGYATELLHFCKSECIGNGNNIDTVLQSVLSMYYIDNTVFCVTDTLTKLQCHFVTNYIINQCFYYGNLHKITDLYDDLSNSNYVCCSNFGDFDLLDYLLANGWLVSGDKQLVFKILIC